MRVLVPCVHLFLTFKTSSELETAKYVQHLCIIYQRFYDSEETWVNAVTLAFYCKGISLVFFLDRLRGEGGS